MFTDYKKRKEIDFEGYKIGGMSESQMEMLTDNVVVEEKVYNPLGECWICDQWIYSLIFWSESIGEKHADYTGKKNYKAKVSVVE